MASLGSLGLNHDVVVNRYTCFVLEVPFPFPSLLCFLQLWDVSAGSCVRTMAGHTRRAWSVHFAASDPTKLASGSDDCTVRLWSMNEVR